MHRCMGHTAWAREGRSQGGPKCRKLEVGARRAPKLLVESIFPLEEPADKPHAKAKADQAKLPGTQKAKGIVMRLPGQNMEALQLTAQAKENPRIVPGSI